MDLVESLDSQDLHESHSLQKLQNLNVSDFDILIAKCGKSIGLKGEIKLIIYSDFSEIWEKGNVFLCKDLMQNSHKDLSKSDAFFLTLKSFNPHKQSAFFETIDSIDKAKNLTSSCLYSSKSLSQKYCILHENEHFWFDIVGMGVVDNGEIMGVVSEIERIGNVDYLLITTNPEIFIKYPHIKAKKFYLPYIPRYILDVKKNTTKNLPQTPQNSQKGYILVCDSLGILEES